VQLRLTTVADPRWEGWAAVKLKRYINLLGLRRSGGRSCGSAPDPASQAYGRADPSSRNTDSDRWIGTSVEINPRDLEPAKGRLHRPVRRGRVILKRRPCQRPRERQGMQSSRAQARAFRAGNGDVLRPVSQPETPCGPTAREAGVVVRREEAIESRGRHRADGREETPRRSTRTGARGPTSGIESFPGSPDSQASGPAILSWPLS